MARKLRVILLAQAADDLREIYDPLYSKIIHRMRLLSQFPEMGVAIPAAMRGWRTTVVGIFRIVYRVKPNRIEIGYIRHCRRAFSGTEERE